MVATDLKPGEIHLLHSPVEVPSTVLKSYSKTLTQEEWERGNRYHFTKDKNQFIVARGLLRIILGHYLQTQPEQIQIQIGEFGKPFLGTPLQFNVAHSGGQILLAFARDKEIGVDIESLRLGTERMVPLAKRICTGNELEALDQLAETERELALYRLWTAKEAHLKALGTGLQLEPRAIEIEPHIFTGSGGVSTIRRVGNPSYTGPSPSVYPLPDCERHFGASAAYSSNSELHPKWRNLHDLGID